MSLATTSQGSFGRRSQSMEMRTILRMGQFCLVFACATCSASRSQQADSAPTKASASSSSSRVPTRPKPTSTKSSPNAILSVAPGLIPAQANVPAPRASNNEQAGDGPNPGRPPNLCGDFPPTPQHVGPGQISLPQSSKSNQEAGGPAIAVALQTWTNKPPLPQSSINPLGPFAIGDFFGVIAIDAVKLRQIVFHTGISDPHQCCIGMIDGRITFECFLSGADDIIGRGVVSVVDDTLALRWCMAMVHSRGVVAQGERKFKVARNARLRLAPSQVPCSPKSPDGSE